MTPRIPILLIATLVGAGCGDDPGTDAGSDACTQPLTWYTDADGDGYGDAGGSVEACTPPSGTVGNALDCDDADAAVKPGGVETCDGLDNDCNGIADDDAEDATTWYADQDGDGVAGDLYTTRACTAPEGWFATADDCDDTRAEVAPGAEELCDGLDNDCDGDLDEDSADVSTYWADADGDGFGDPAAPVTACAAPPNTVADATDCDDTRADAFPGAAETCDGLDQDCDGTADEDATDAQAWYDDLDGDGHGAGTPTLACAPLDGQVAQGDDCDDTSPARFPGASELCDGADDDCDGMVDEDAVDAAVWYIDYDGDGFGSTRMRTAACTTPDGYVADSGDCDDTRADRFPGAPESCDGVDQDCDGTVDEDPTDPTAFYADADGDGHGDAGAVTLACTLPAGHVTLATDCDDGDASVKPGGVEACDGIDNDCDGATDEDDAVDAPTWYIDYDGDGFGSAAMTRAACVVPDMFVDNTDDCDDTRAETFPGATETCDDDDNDCDGEVDEDAIGGVTWFADADGDGFGDVFAPLEACHQPVGFVEDPGDCDDSDGGVHPDAVEYCNGADDDCDGSTDGRDAVDVLPWYADADGDGVGNAASAVLACTQPSGYGATSGDCNDAEPAIHPGAAEYCDTLDNDCDGVVDDGDALDALTWYLDGDGDGFGDPASATPACTRPARYVSDATDCDDASASTFPGAEEICNDGVDNDCSGDFGACVVEPLGADAVVRGEASYDYFAGMAIRAGDVNGDGWDDLLVGAESADRDYATADSGAAYLFYGPVAPSTLSADEADVVLLGEAASDKAGSALAGGRDLNGDGYADFMVSGKRNAAGVGTATGAAYLFYGPVTGGTMSLGDADAKLTGEHIWDFAGIQLDFPGDLDGDGHQDLAIVADSNDLYGANAGTVYLVHGPVTGDLSLAAADVMLGGETAYDYAGVPRGAGDVDGDGIADLMVGVANQDGAGTDAGKVYLLSGGGLADMSLRDAEVHLTGALAGDRFGSSLSPAGDVNHDGYADVWVGATRYDAGGSDAGAVFLFHGPLAAGTRSAATADAVVTGLEAEAHLGASVKGDWDMDGDGELDMITGANEAAAGAGTAWLFKGPITGTITTDSATAMFRGDDADDSVGDCVGFAGNLAGDGGNDALLIGAAQDDAGGADAGALYLVFGIAQ